MTFQSCMHRAYEVLEVLTDTDFAFWFGHLEACVSVSVCPQSCADAYICKGLSLAVIN